MSKGKHAGHGTPVTRYEDQWGQEQGNAQWMPSGMVPINPYSRSSYAEGLANKKGKRKRRKRIGITIALVIIAMLVCAGTAAALYFSNQIKTIDENFSQGLDADIEDALVETNAPSDPFYVLLMGTDESIERSEDNTFGGIYRTDTIILARVDPGNKKVTMISIPRDTQVDMGEYGLQKINAAYAYGGASLAVKTVSELCDVDIAHFVLVDMDGLAAIVDNLGGIEVDVPMEIDDEDYTGHLDAGLQTLDGWQTLIFARSRHAYDSVGDGDLLRAANQRTVISAIVDKLFQSDIITMSTSITNLSSFIQTDLTVSEIVEYAQALKGIDTTTDVYSATAPVESVYENNIWWCKLIEDEWQEMLSRMKQGLAPTEEQEVDSATGIVLSSVGDSGTASVTADANATSTTSVTQDGNVVVKNGSGVSGAASSAATMLAKAGFNVTEVGDADSDKYTSTLIIYASDDYADEAKTINETMGGSNTVMKNDGTYTMTGDLLVVLGSADAS
ncbi:LCP family protein [Denitrobacterium detoxificans]|jgi:LCP family protein required for cell wall assembly|uniref:LCP family protein n=1 Tax=Denitrobacterium detoxificans TaxID=79604 RepID=UPI0026ED56D9|nr:LCP family protein [Denitrobacterium detoxificans]MBE6465314.1 LytR family transcriptional regulator [Denitrobacterium detoxificans]